MLPFGLLQPFLIIFFVGSSAMGSPWDENSNSVGRDPALDALFSEPLRMELDQIDSELWRRHRDCDCEVGVLELLDQDGAPLIKPKFLKGKRLYIPDFEVDYALDRVFQRARRRGVTNDIRRLRMRHVHPTLPGLTLVVGEEVILDGGYETRSRHSTGDQQAIFSYLKLLQTIGFSGLQFESQIIFEGRENGILEKVSTTLAGDFAQPVPVRSFARQCLDMLLLRPGPTTHHERLMEQFSPLIRPPRR